jgi:hypothetical protein
VRNPGNTTFQYVVQGLEHSKIWAGRKIAIIAMHQINWPQGFAVTCASLFGLPILDKTACDCENSGTRKTERK